MAQVGSLQLVGAADPICPPSQEISTSQVSQSEKNVAESLDKVNEQSSNREKEKVTVAEVMDDDVQLVLSVPRRRKKKRKRFAFSNSPLGQYQETQIPKEEGKSIESSARRKSTSVVQRLESCHLSDKDTGLRRGSLPTVPMSIVNPVQLSWTHEPNYSTNQHAQFPSFPLPWWDEPTSPLSHVPMATSGWGSWQEDITPKKRKYEDGWHDNGPSRKQYRQSTQVSPRSNPVAMPSTTRFSHQQQPNNGISNTYERQMSDHSSNMTWPSFDWEPYRIINPQYVSPYTQSTMPMDISDSNHGSMSQSEHQPSFQDWSQHTNMFSQDFDPNQGSCTSMFSPSQSPVQQPVATPTRYPMQPPASPRLPLQQPVAPLRIQPPQPSTPSPTGTTLTPASNVEAQTVPYSSTAPAHTTPPSAQPSTRTPNSSDIQRRPSLYKIPAWPPTTIKSPSITTQMHSSSSASRVVPPSTANSINPESGRRTTASSHTDESSISSTATTKVPQLPSPIVVQKPRPASTAESRVNGPVSPLPRASPSPTPRDQSPSTGTGTGTSTSTEPFQIPRARPGRKNSPNLIVDIAETCQEVFPFAAVAERHGIALQKVFDTFAAIIQLPLLRNADDRRRHGSLGKRRMKEYRDAKKAMERAKEAEKKAEMKAMRARADDAARKREGMVQGQGQLQGQGQMSGTGNVSGAGKGLLKAAILNNVEKSQGAGNV